VLNGLADSLRQQRTVIAWPKTYLGGSNEMCFVIGDDGQFGPATVSVGSFALPHEKMAANKTGFKAG